MSCTDGDRLPYVFLDEVHLGRWRGHCLARLGAAEAIDDLDVSPGVLDPSFARAQSALLVDLALAHIAPRRSRRQPANTPSAPSAR